jgi:hypothetical protein
MVGLLNKTFAVVEWGLPKRAKFLLELDSKVRREDLQ